jgi:hypothetical protein
MLHRILSVVVIIVFALGTVVLADPPTVTIDQQATLVQLSDPVGGGPPITIGVAVTVVVNCGDGDPGQFELNVGVRQGEDVIGETGGVFFTSTGGRQEITTEVYGPYDVGTASASAVLACQSLLEGMELGQTIRISE